MLCKKVLDQLVASGDFINSTTKTGELVNRLVELDSLDSSRVAEYKANIKERFDAEQDETRLKRMQHEGEGGLTSIVNLHGKLHTCAKSLANHVPGLELKTNGVLMRLLQANLDRAKNEIARMPDVRKGVPPSLGVNATKEFVGAAPLLKDIMPKEVSELVHELSEVSRQNVNAMRLRLNAKLESREWNPVLLSFQLLRCFAIESHLGNHARFRDFFTKQLTDPSFENRKIRELGKELELIKGTTGEVADAARKVIMDIGAFEQYKNADYNKKAGGVDKVQAIDGLRMRSTSRPDHRPNQRTLDQAFKGFDEMFNDLVNEIMKGSADSRWQGNNVRQAREIASGLDPTRLYMKARETGQLLGRIAAQMTVSKLPSATTNAASMQSRARAESARVEREKLYVPHATQCLGTFLLAGLAANDDLENHMVRCLTGEGKSICLALTSTLFAMLGYTVNVTCYSKLLSERDERGFRDLFRAMAVEGRITYSTLGGLIEKLVQPGGALPDLGEATARFLEGGSYLDRVSDLVTGGIAEGTASFFGIFGSPTHTVQQLIDRLEAVAPRFDVKRDGIVNLDLAWRLLAVSQEFESKGGRRAGKKSALAARKDLFLVLHPDKLGTLHLDDALRARAKKAFLAISESLGALERAGFPNVPQQVDEARCTVTPFRAATIPKTLLLIDEVDVLFDSKFHGQTFNPCKILRSDAIFTSCASLV